MPSMYPSFIIRQDLWDVIRQAENWSLDCIKAGETNAKGFLFVCLIRTWLEAMLLLLPGDDGEGDRDGETLRRLVIAAEEAGKTCLGVLEGIVGDVGGGGGDGDGGWMEGGDGGVEGFVGGMEGLDFENVTVCSCFSIPKRYFEIRADSCVFRCLISCSGSKSRRRSVGCRVLPEEPCPGLEFILSVSIHEMHESARDFLPFTAHE